jgi:catechol 1,2-dioxygenase
MNRKEFIVSTSLAAFSLSAFGSAIKQTNGSFKGDCETTNDILGPYYRPDAPLRNDLRFDGITGTQVMVKGRVFSSDCITLLPGAVVEIWHCSADGQYDNESAEYRHRAKWITDQEGSYSFKTIIPGKYLNGELYRPSHIHYRVTETSSAELISQIYFQGDPHIAKDPWASDKKASHRTLPIIPEDVSGNLVIIFDIYLKEK